MPKKNEVRKVDDDLLVHAIILMMKMKEKKTTTTLKSVSTVDYGVLEMGSGSGELGRLGLIKKAKSCRQRRLRIRRLKFTCQAKEENERDHEEAEERLTELSLSASYSSSSDSCSEKSPEKGEESCGVETERCLTSHGLVSLIGRRREMEDAVRVEEGLVVVNGGGRGKFDFFGVYDGHGGFRVAEACKERLHQVLLEVMKAGEDQDGVSGGIGWERVMEECFERMDEEVNRGRVREEMVGSTAVVAVVSKEEVVVANCGDSRAVLSRGGVVVPLSIDHKPERPDELRRVEAAGGRVINWNGHRILGVLATSRSIGDQYLKPFVISKPEVTVSERTDNDEFLILASDGLWDVVSNEVACQVVRKCFTGRIKWASLDVVDGTRAARAATVLANLAMARGSSDNISVIVVDLSKPNHFLCC